MKTRILLTSAVIALLAFGCSKDDNNSNSESFSADEATVNTKIDMANEDVSQIVENQATAQDGITGRDGQGIQDFLPSCATVTRVPAFGTVPEAGTTITKTIDFGTSGCPLANGNVLKGKIVMTFTYDPDATTHTINYHFDNFYHNSIKFDGDKTFTRTLGTSTANAETHPIVTMNMDFDATFPDGNVYHRTGTRVHEITAGYDTPNVLSDNVYQVTGSWTTTFPNESVLTSTISSPLIVKLSCTHIVQGIIGYQRGGFTATLDYGNGDCDNFATFTYNGTAHNIILGL